VQAILAEQVSVAELRGMLRVRELTGTAAGYEPEAITPVIQPLYCQLWELMAVAGVSAAGPAFAVRTREVYAWLGARGLASTGPPFLKYDVIDMMRQLEVVAGVPVGAPVEGDSEVDGCPARRVLRDDHAPGSSQ
jgi:hypothetical protein